MPRSDAALSLALHRAARRVEAASAPVVYALRLDYETYLVLAHLWSADGAEIARLGTSLGMTEAETLRCMDVLVGRGYSEQQGSAIWLTDEGHRARAVASHALDHRAILDDRPLADTRRLLDQLATTLTP